MKRFRVSWLARPAALIAILAAGLSAQVGPSSSPANRVTSQPPLAAIPIENLYVPPIPNEPFSADAIVTLTRSNPNGTVARFELFNRIARDSSGRIYIENRRPVAKSGAPPGPSQITLIDVAAHTRTTCFVTTKSCLMNSIRHIDYDETEGTYGLPRASASETVDLGTDVIDSLEVTGTRVMTTIAEGAVGNRQAFTVTKELWVSPELQLDISMTRTDPRTGTQTRKIIDISRSEPEPRLFTVPPDYKLLDNRQTAN